MMLGLQDKALAMIGFGSSVALAGALVFVWVSKEATIASRDRDVRELSAERKSLQQSWDDCKANGRVLEQAIISQNDALLATKASSAARVEALEKVADNADANADRARREAQRIMNSKASTENLCDAANALILEESQ